MSHSNTNCRLTRSFLCVAAMALTAFACAPLNAQNVKVADNTPGFIKHAADLGPTDPTTVITATVWLQLHNQNQLDQLVEQQGKKGNANYRRWITQAQFNAMFGPTPQELNAVKNYLAAKKLTVVTVAENNMYVKVQGTVAQMEQVFAVQIHNYKLNGQIHRSNTSDPSVNATVGPHVAAVTGLDDLGFNPMIVRPSTPEGGTFKSVPLASTDGKFFEGQCFRSTEQHTFTSSSATASYAGNRYGADITNTAYGHLAPCGYQPSELQTAYNMTALYSQKDAAGKPLDGTGETVVITDAFGSATIAQDAEAFSQIYGLPDLTPANFQIMQAPGSVQHPNNPRWTNDWAGEITLDVELVHAMAPGAKIVLVISPNNGADLDEAVNWAVVHHFGNTISNSWSGLEGFGNPAQFNRVNRILEMAAAQGVDVNYSSGDSGDNTSTAGFVTVGFPGSSPYATSVGGTSMFLNPDNTMNMQTGWGTNLTAIANTQAAGNPPYDPPFNEGFIYGAGGGTSLTFAKPSFQAGLPGTMRLLPDISLLADPYTGAEIIETVGGQLSVGVIGGTSLACPMFSGVMAIAAQRNGHVGLGQAAARVYNLPAGAVSDVTDISSANNVVGSITDANGTADYTSDQLVAPLGNTTSYVSAFYNSPFSTRWFVISFGTDTSLTTGPGWDNVTGVGTPNGAAFVNAIVQ